MSRIGLDDWNRDRMANGQSEPPKGVPFRQIDPGTFMVIARGGGSTTPVGMVFVEGKPREFVVEHWVLSEGHASPTQEQSFEVTSCEESYDSLGAFFAAMQTRSRDWSKVTYIKATCEYQTGIPTG